MQSFPDKSAARHGRDRGERGNTLLVTVVVLAMLTLLAAGAINMSGREVSAAAAKRRYDEVTSCARAGRELILSQFKLSGPPPASMKAVIPGSGTDLLTVGTGHYDTDIPCTTCSGASAVVSFKPVTQAGVARGAEDISNKVTGGGSTQPVTYAIVCQNSSGHRYELEFSVQFGF